MQTDSYSYVHIVFEPNCTRTLSEAVYASLSFMETAGGAEAAESLANSSFWKNAVADLVFRLSSDGKKRKKAPEEWEIMQMEAEEARMAEINVLIPYKINISSNSRNLLLVCFWRFEK